MGKKTPHLISSLLCIHHEFLKCNFIVYSIVFFLNPLLFPSLFAQRRVSAMNSQSLDARTLFLIDTMLKVLRLLFHVVGKT